MLFIALGIGWLFDAGLGWARDHRRWQGWVPGFAGMAVAAMLISTALWSYQYYFVEWGTGKQLFRWFDVGLVALGQYAASTPANTRLYYTPVSEVDVLHLPVKWQVRDRELRTFDGKLGAVLPPSDSHPSLYLITTWRNSSWPVEALGEFYPDGHVVYGVSNPEGERHSLAFAVDANTAPVLPLHGQVKTSFEEGIDLLGGNLSSNEISAGETLTMTLFWQSVTGPTQMSHTVFMHLLGPAKADGSVTWAGHDSPPLGNTYPTTRWSQGEIIVDRHTLTVPADAPPGVYQIETGIYTPERRGARLRTLDAAGQPVGDNAIIGAVTVR